MDMISEIIAVISVTKAGGIEAGIEGIDPSWHRYVVGGSAFWVSTAARLAAREGPRLT
jgi:hypothetical protein